MSVIHDVKLHETPMQKLKEIISFKKHPAGADFTVLAGRFAFVVCIF